MPNLLICVISHVCLVGMAKTVTLDVVGVACLIL